MNPDILAAYQHLDADQRALIHADFSATLCHGDSCTLDGDTCMELCPLRYFDCSPSNRLERWQLWLQLHRTEREQPALFGDDDDKVPSCRAK